MGHGSRVKSRLVTTFTFHYVIAGFVDHFSFSPFRVAPKNVKNQFSALHVESHSVCVSVELFSGWWEHV
jgi:hypothetical protein